LNAVCFKYTAAYSFGFKAIAPKRHQPVVPLLGTKCTISRPVDVQNEVKQTADSLSLRAHLVLETWRRSSKDVDIFAIGAVSLNYIYTHESKSLC
jgi:hypothetical protein